MPCVDCSWRASAAILSRVPLSREVTSRRNWLRVLVHEVLASQIGLASSAVSTGPAHSNMSATLAEVHADGVAEGTHSGDEPGRVVDFPERLIAAELVLHVIEGVDKAADAGDGLNDFAAYIAEAGRQVAGTPAQRSRSPVRLVIWLDASRSSAPISPA